MKVVIRAGGKGTRISSAAREIPKSMIEVEGKPILEYGIECLREQGFCDIMIAVGYLGNMIIDYFGDGSRFSPVTNKPFGVNIEYYYEEEPLWNAKRLYESKKKLTEDFLLMNASYVYNVDLKRFVAYHKEHGGLATLLTYPNSHPYDSEIIVTDENGAVEKWFARKDKKPEFYHNRVNSGLYMISPKLLENVKEDQQIDFKRQMLEPLVGTGKLFAYDSHEYVKDMETLERYTAVCRDFNEERVHIKNLQNKQRAVFIDGNGAINNSGKGENINDFELAPGVEDAIKHINDSGYLAIVVNNQAKGEVTDEQLEAINSKMETLLGAGGSYIDAIYSCSYNFDNEYETLDSRVEMEYSCHKPSAIMLYKAAEKFNIDLSKSWMVGESENDMKVGVEAGCATVKIDEKFNLLHFVKEYIW